MKTAKKSTKEQILAWVYTILALTPIFILGYMLGEELNKAGF